MPNREHFKKMAVRDLEPGMFVVDIGLSWLDNPYLYSDEGLIATKTAVENIQTEGFLEAYVDPARSLVPYLIFPPIKYEKPQLTQAY